MEWLLNLNSVINGMNEKWKIALSSAKRLWNGWRENLIRTY